MSIDALRGFDMFFIVGVSLVFSLSKSTAAEGQAPTSIKILKRSLILYLLGVLTYHGISCGIDQVRPLAFC